ncbi:MAG: DUF4177 domain-containing protein [Flavobacteriaceae bacterium]|nr:DUF4177 domain-containing protein [Flavobacteriaceae bacterium]
MNINYIRVENKFGLGANKISEDYQEIIRQHATEGWRLVQIFDPAVGAAGSATFIEIILEPKIK